MRVEEGSPGFAGRAWAHGPDRAPRLSVVVPLYDEAPTLTPLYEAVRDVCVRKGFSFELIFIDDGSHDGSLAILTAIARRDSHVRVIRLRRNFGKAAALSTGFRAARGESVVTMDADLQDDPEEIPRLVARLWAGYGMVSGWKRRRNDPLSRKVASKVFNWATRRLSRVKLHDFNCGLKAYSNECAKEIAGSCYGELHRYLPVLAYHKGFAVTEIEVNHHERANGRSRYGLERYVRGFLDLFTVVFMSRYTRRPMHVFGGVGLLLFVPGSLSLLWLVGLKVVLGQAIGGRPLLILGAVACIAGLQFMLTGLVAEMISAPRAAEVPHSPVIVPPEIEPRIEDDLEGTDPSVVELSDEEVARVQPLQRLGVDGDLR